MSTRSVRPQAALPLFARLYGCSESEFAGTAAQMTAAWTVQDSAGTFLGALGLRPSPAHGAEVLGGALKGPEQQPAALALLRAALGAQPRLYAYAEGHLLPGESLESAGLREVRAYTRMSGPVPVASPDPGAEPEVPAGFRIVPLTQVPSREDRLSAQRCFSHRIGHTLVPDEAGSPDAFGTDDRLGRLAYDASGVPAGLCRGLLEGDQAMLGTPGVRPDVQDSGLRRALLLSACGAARAAGAARLVLDAWGDTAQERAGDLALGLQIATWTPIYAPV